MVIGLPREIKTQEHRVALLPSAAYLLAQRGHQVLVEAGAGLGSGYGDDEYTRAGAILVREHAEVFARADLVYCNFLYFALHIDACGNSIPHGQPIQSHPHQGRARSTH